MLHRYISVLILLASNGAGQPVSVDEVREALETEGVVPRGRFSFEEAREALEAACRSPLSPTHEALCSSDRGLWYQLQGQFTQAEAQYMRAVSGFEKAPVMNQRLLAMALHNLGATYRELRRLEDAKQVLSRALALRQQAYGDDHPLTASTLGQLGTIHLAAGELTRAEVLLQSALSTHERLLPPAHPDRVSIVHNLAQLRIAQNDYTSAIKLLQGLIAPLNGTTDPPSLVHAAPYQTLAALYRRLGQPARALPLLKKAQRLYEESFGPDDLTAALVRVEFGLLSAAEGKNHLAKTELREAHARLVKILGAHHPQVASVKNNLAVVCLHLGDLDEAVVLLVS
jgi:tetratricopeptide (TPR) repeat protein